MLHSKVNEQDGYDATSLSVSCSFSPIGVNFVVGIID